MSPYQATTSSDPSSGSGSGSGSNSIAKSPGFLSRMLQDSNLNQFKEKLEDSAWNVLGTFSSFTSFTRNAIVGPINDDDEYDHRPTKDSSDYLDTFQKMIVPVYYLPEQYSWTGHPFTRTQFERDYMSLSTPLPAERIEALKLLIFCGGVESSLRSCIWPFLLNIQDWQSTESERRQKQEQQMHKYAALKSEWQSLEMNTALHTNLDEHENRIVKDVLRTDRHIPYYNVGANALEGESESVNAVENHEKLQMMRDILVTFCYKHADLGYVQGMSDLLSPILFVMDDESMAFWAFCEFMEQTKDHFAENGAKIQEDLKSIEQLVRILLPDLYYFLKSHMVLHFFFCYRWILVLFKREFAFHDVCSLWEVLWCNPYSPRYALFICLGILKLHANAIMSKSDGFDEILKYINDLSQTLDLKQVLIAAEELFFRFRYIVQYIDISSLKALVAPAYQL